MSPILFYSDLHLRPERLGDCDLVLQEIGKIAGKLKEKRGEVTIVNGGDTFNTRGLIKTSCFDVLQRHYRDWSSKGFNQIILVGNHDQEDREGEVHPMRVFDEIAWVVDSPKFFPGLDLMAFPYMSKDKIEDAIKDAPKGSYAVAHWGIKGAMRNGGNMDEDGVPAEWLKKFKKVFCGHYHYRSSFANVQYIGSPMQQNFGEMGQDKGVLVFDGDIDFIELKSPPKHYEAQIHWDGKKEQFLKPDGVRDKDFLRVKVFGDAERCSSVDQDYIRKRIKCDNVKIEREVSEKAYTRMEIKDHEVLSPVSLMEKYVDFISTDLDKKRLLGLGREILG